MLVDHFLSKDHKGRRMHVFASTNRQRILATFGLALAVFGGCSKPAPVSPRPDAPANVLATVGDENITLEQFAAEMASHRTANDPKAKQALLDELLRVHVLAQEARRRGYDHDPQMITAYDALLANRLRAEIHTQAKPSAQEIEAYYHAHSAEFNTPAFGAAAGGAIFGGLAGYVGNALEAPGISPETEQLVNYLVAGSIGLASGFIATGIDSLSKSVTAPPPNVNANVSPTPGDDTF